jgi:hypothetical protein
MATRVNAVANAVRGRTISDKELNALKNLLEASKNRSTGCADLNSPEVTREGEVSDSGMVQAVQPLFIFEHNG